MNMTNGRSRARAVGDNQISYKKFGYYLLFPYLCAIFKILFYKITKFLKSNFNNGQETAETAIR